MASMKDFSDLKGLRETLKEQDERRAIEQAEREERERVLKQEVGLFRTALGGVKKIPESNRYVPNAPPGINVTIKPAKPRSQAEDDAAVLRESLSDQFEVDHLLDDDPSLSFTRSGVGSDVVRKLRKGYWPVQDELDLHGMRRDSFGMRHTLRAVDGDRLVGTRHRAGARRERDMPRLHLIAEGIEHVGRRSHERDAGLRDGAREAIGDFLHNAGKRKLRCVCVIHGKGLGSAGGEPVLRSMVHSWLEQKDDVIAFCAANVDGRSHGALIVLLKGALSVK